RDPKRFGERASLIVGAGSLGREFITILHPKSKLSLDATVVGTDGSGTCVCFNSAEAGTVAFEWARMLREEA
ncbi:MAG: hypothetical protein OSB69_04425, partial [Alphaproteobacteria bacterium]|nr:hypothetical protein [Alphaproteobacteria bacterium]